MSEGDSYMIKRILSIIFALVICMGLATQAFAGEAASACMTHSVFIREDGSVWASGIADLCDGTPSTG